MKGVYFLCFFDACDALTNIDFGRKRIKAYQSNIMQIIEGLQVPISIAPLRQGLCFQCFGVHGNAKLCLVTQVLLDSPFSINTELHIKFSTYCTVDKGNPGELA
jgi:hypothetical protein